MTDIKVIVASTVLCRVTLRCGRINPGSNPGHEKVFISYLYKLLLLSFVITFVELSRFMSRISRCFEPYFYFHRHKNEK